MKTFKEFQKEIMAKYPSFKSLPFLTRYKIKWLDYPSTCTDSIEEGNTKMSLTYKTYFYKGQFYFDRFGW